MSVDPINLSRTEVPLTRAMDPRVVPAPSAPRATSLEPGPDLAVVSDRARQMSAALAGHRAIPKLRLSPQELRDLVSPRKSASEQPQRVTA